MPNFLIVIRTPTEPTDPPLTDEQRAALMARYEEWVGTMGDRLLAAERLVPREGRVIQRRPKTTVVDGPYLETKEMIAGFWLVEAADYDAVLADAQRMPFETWTLEIRAIAKG